MNIIKNRMALAISFIFITSALLLSFTYKPYIQGLFDKKFKLKEQEIYFNALVKGKVPIKSLQYKLNNLPGVVKVQMVQSEALKSKIADSLNDIEVDLPEELTVTDYHLLKVNLANNINSKSLSIIKEYLVRVVGGDSLTLSSLKRKSGIDKKNSFLVSFLKRVSTYIAVLISTLWFGIFFLISAAVENEVYIAEKFQRKKNVKVKAFSILTLFSLVPIMALAIFDSSFMISRFLITLIPIVALHTMLLKKTRWRESR